MHADQSPISRSWLCAIALIGLMASLSGCCREVTTQAYWGPTKTISAVAAEVNANNELIPTLWANTTFRAKVVDQGRSYSIGGSGVLLYRRPGDLFLRGNDAILGPIFEIGSNGNDYWMKLIPQVETAWYGAYRNLGRPCVAPLPIRPDLLIEVLGVSTFNTRLLEQPVPVMRFNHEADAYMFVWNIRLADRWAAQKEVWYDRQSLQPKKVILFDENGRTLLSATLSGTVQVDVAELPESKRPMMTREYNIYFPESQAELQLTLSDVALKKTNKRVTVPNNLSFRKPGDDQWGVNQVINVDANCGD